MNVNVRHIKYGSYTEEYLKSLCSEADACVLLTGTESQGIAYMQILSCGIPCYVIDQKIWHDDIRKVSFPATSAPYFDDSCGVKYENFDDEMFNDFLNMSGYFDPRSFMIKDHTLEESAKRYVEILQKNNCNV